jgi:glycosyltransferase involved in cell wall biosynthesis
MNLYVHPSNGEGFGLAAVEAMLAGFPVVVANAGAFPEYVRAMETGLLFQPGDVVDLAKKMEALLSDSELRDRLAWNGREYCLMHFARTRFSGEITEILERRPGRGD